MALDRDRDGRLSDAELASVNPPSRYARRGVYGPAVWVRFIGRNARRMAVAIVGFSILVSGLVMLVAPGPGVVIIVVGLAVLATEFVWAERALDRAKGSAAKASASLQNNAAGKALLVASGSVMVIGGLAVIALVEGWTAPAAGVTAGGLVALGTLLPRVQNWLSGRTG